MSSISDVSPPLSVAALDAALDNVLSNSFDADSKTTLTTFMKILDNIIAKPADDKVRTLKLDNKVIQQKILTRKGGLDFLLACGFRVVSDSALLSRARDERLVLVDENTQHLLTARRLLHTRAVRDLQMDLQQLPPINPPPSVMPNTSVFTQNNESNANANFTFDPYAGHRFDAKAHASGIPSIEPDLNYKSPTEVKLQKLQQQKEQLERATRMQPPPRDWMALQPGQAMPLPATSTHDNNDSSNSATTSSFDSSLIAQRMQQQQIAAQERERFTTRAMRDLKILERKRIYSHVTLTIQFNNGVKLIGKFLPCETIAAVKQAMISECFTSTASRNQVVIDLDGDVAMNEATAPQIPFDLFLTPPRRVLDEARTLEQEGLVPAAKIFCTATQQLLPQLFAVHDVDFSVGQAVTGVNVANSSSTNAASKADPKEDKKKKLASREEALMQRMMGNKPRMGDAGGSNNNEPGKNATKKPKWFG
jgi:hypothetical protein